MNPPQQRSPAQLARSLRLALEAEAALGIDGVPLPATARCPADLSQPTPDPAAEGAVAAELAAMAAEVATCARCGLARGRQQVVFGEGPPRPRLMFVGEGPGSEEDRSGRPFVGPAGHLLDRIIAAATLRREDVYIANVVKCRPPGNRAPNPDEAAACMPYLHEQIRLLGPEVICTLGAPATRAILERSEGINRLRGRCYPYPRDPEVSVIPTFHPAYLLRCPADKAKTWADIQLVMRQLGIDVPEPRK